MDFRPHFHGVLERSFPAESFSEIRVAVDERYRVIFPGVSFARTSANPMDRRLDFCAYFLATIQALEARGCSFEQIKAICVNIAHSYVTPRNAWGRFLKRLPAKLIATPLGRIVARVMDKKISKKGHPDGFLVHVVTDPRETFGLRYGFDIIECGVCALFKKHGALHYVPILCEVDRLTSAMVGLELVRHGTLSTGAEKCDFRFKIVK